MQKSLKKKRKQKTDIVDNPVISAFIKTQIFAVLISISVFVTVSAVMLLVGLPSKYDIIVSLAAFSLVTVSVGYFSGIKIRSKGMVIGLLFSLPIITLVTMTSLIFNNFKADINIVYSIVSMLISSSVGGILAVNKRLK